MKELKIFSVIAIFTAVLYWGVEPLAHSVFHPGLHEKQPDFSFSDLKGVDTSLTGDATAGQDVIQVIVQHVIVSLHKVLKHLWMIKARLIVMVLFHQI